jgi:iron complex outermembrane receptor protein
MLTLASVLLALPGYGAENTPSDITSEEYYFQEMPVVLTASRLSQPLSEAPSAMTVIDREMIKASGFRTVPELMQLVPGMYVGYVDGNTPVLSLHNSTDQYSRQMQVLIDGRSVYMPPLGGVNWADLPLQFDDIERIEVVRGPSSASHGANSFYGVINILTRDVAAEPGAGRVSVTGGGFASDASAKFSRTGEQFDYRISAAYRSDSGYSNSFLNDHNQTRITNFSGNYHPNGSDSFNMQLGSSNGVYGKGIVQTTGVPTPIIRTDNLFRDTTANSDFQQLSWLHIWSTNDESKLTYSHTADLTFDPMLCTTPSGPGCIVNGSLSGLVQSSVYGQRDVIELQNTNQLGDSNRLVWGANTERAYASYPLLLNSSPTVNSWQIFAHDEWRISRKAILNVGSMFEDNGMGYQNNSPRASLNYHLTPQHTLRVGISTATRSPAMMEKYIDASTAIFGGAYAPPATPLTPEKILSREIGYIGEFPSLGMNLNTRVYIDQVSDMILVDKCVDGVLCNQDSWKNLGYAEFKGVDATLKYFWDEKHSSLTANYAYQRATLGLSSLPTQYLSSFPTPYSTILGPDVQTFYQTQALNLFPETVDSNSGSLLISQRIADSWQLSAGYYFRASVRVLDVSTDVTPESRMRRLDLRLAKTFKLDKGRSVEVAAIVQNVTQDVYTKYDTLNAEVNVVFTRRSWLTAALNF